MSYSRKLLILTPRWPYPPFGGDKLFVSHVAKALREHSLTLLSLCSTHEEMICDPEPGIFTEVHKVYLPRHRSYCIKGKEKKKKRRENSAKYREIL